MSADVAGRLRQLAHDHHDGRLDLAAYRALRAPLLESLVPNSGAVSPVLEVTQPRGVLKPAAQVTNGQEPKRPLKSVTVVVIVLVGAALVLAVAGVWMLHGGRVSGGGAGRVAAGADGSATVSDVGEPQGAVATAAGLSRILDLVGPFLDRGDWSDGRLASLNATLLEVGGAQIAAATHDARLQRFIDELRARLKEQQALATTPLTADNSPLAALAVTVGIDLNSPDSALHVAPLPAPVATESGAGVGGGAGTAADGASSSGRRAAAAGPPSAASQGGDSNSSTGSTPALVPASAAAATLAATTSSTATAASTSAATLASTAASSSAPTSASTSTQTPAAAASGTHDIHDTRDARDAPDTTCALELIRSRRPLCHDTLSNGIEGPLLALIPAGSFDMGSTASPEEQPVHHVTIQQPFAISVYEVSQGEFRQYCEHAKRPCASQPWSGDDYPVVNVSWDDARAYTEWLSEATHRHYSLPTEAQWEYAARAGRTGLFPSGDALSATDAQFSGPTKQTAAARRSQTFNANAFRLVHTVGNVREWVEDPWVQSFVGAPSDGSAVKSVQTASRVVRGGSYADGATRLRLSMREGLPLNTHDVTTGFRIARELP